MVPQKKSIYILVAACILFGLNFMQASSLWAANSDDPSVPVGITPTLVSGNPALCPGGFRIDPPAAGTYPLDAFGNTVTVVISSTANGQVFSWEVSDGIVIDQVVAKGGDAANVYDYTAIDPAPTFDGKLHSPVNSSGKYANLSHIDFCYHYQLTVTKSAETSYTRTYLWDIEKSVTPDTLDLFTGDSADVTYEIAVTKSGYEDSDWAVNGEITIVNNTPFAATITGVSDTISGFGAVAVQCGVTYPYALAPKDTLVCSYSTALPNGTNRINTATVTTSSAKVQGDTATADVTFGDPTTLVNDTITVEDTNGDSWTFGDSGTVSYPKTFACDSDSGTHKNIATIVETDQSDSASVSVSCYELSVTKNAQTSHTRNWDWTIEKTASEDALTLAVGQSFVVNYNVSVVASATDSDWMAAGSISIANPAPMAATLTSVADLISPNIAATVSCPSLTVPAGGTLVCSYTADLPDATSRTNTATATLQNYSYAADGTATAAGTTDFSGTASVTFGDPTTVVDECVDVTDDLYGALGSFCAELGANSHTFSYDMTVKYDTCGKYTVVNKATFITNDTDTTGNDTHTLDVNVPCAGGCTLTQGYWKTHSSYGPAPYDDTWAQIGEDTTFFLSGQSYYQVLWTSPAGNVYYNLAHQYIAAKLNLLNGAAGADVQGTFDNATSLLSQYTPSTIAGLKANNPTRKEFVKLASILDQYNNGLIGPGHCSEASVSGAALTGEGIHVFLPSIVNR
ncbi:MAG: hypothetical protein KDB03_27345 [Planctomycetales bacterium]|nr:hypothetical protein [Planctomycetales bacterium]